MSLRGFFILCICISGFIDSKGWAQITYMQPVKKIAGFGPFEYGFYKVDWNTDSSELTQFYRNTYPDLKGKPLGLINLKYAIIRFNIGQFVYQNMLTAKISKQDYDLFRESINWQPDMRKLVKEQVKCYVIVASGQDHYGKQQYVIDRNNNHDLSDDPILILPESVSQEEEILKYILRVPYEKKSGSRIIKDTAYLVLVKYHDGIGFTMSEYVRSEFNIEGKKVRLLACSYEMLSASYGRTQCFVWADSMGQKKGNNTFALNDSGYFKVGDKLYEYLGVNGQTNQMRIRNVKKGKHFSAQLDFFAPAIRAKNLVKQKIFTLSEHAGKYVFVDFWGTWCAPCRAEIPHLKEAYGKLKADNIIMVSIAAHNTESDILNFLYKEGLRWPQLISDRIAMSYRVSEFPTNFLINPFGKIIAKNLSTSDLHKSIRTLIDNVE